MGEVRVEWKREEERTRGRTGWRRSEGQGERLFKCAELEKAAVETPFLVLPFFDRFAEGCWDARSLDGEGGRRNDRAEGGALVEEEEEGRGREEEGGEGEGGGGGRCFLLNSFIS